MIIIAAVLLLAAVATFLTSKICVNVEVVCRQLNSFASGLKRIDQQADSFREYEILISRGTSVISKLQTSLGFAFASILGCGRTYSLDDLSGTDFETKMIAALKEIYDPQIPVDIWELGYITNVSFQRGTATVEYTTVSSCSGCRSIRSGMDEWIQTALEALPEVSAAYVRYDESFKYTEDRWSNDARRTFSEWCDPVT